MHEMKNSKGESPLVVVTRRADAGALSAAANGLRFLVIKPAGLNGGLTFTHGITPIQQASSRFTSDPSASVVIFAGRVDTEDTTAFTIGYEMDGERGTIDGYLRDEELVEIRIRDGPAKVIPAQADSARQPEGLFRGEFHEMRPMTSERTDH
jgi:hypothetical protein